MTVAIVGLGISGLRAAMLLERSGVKVELFEALDRVGGRLHTIDAGDGCVFEAGGEWIDGDHARCLDLLTEMEYEPASPAPWPRKLSYKGEWTDEADIWSEAMEDDLRVEASAREICRDLSIPPWRNKARRALDAQTLDDFLIEHTESERGLWYVKAKYRSDEGDDPERVGLLGWLAGFSHYVDRDDDVMSAYRVPGGFGSLCSSMASRLKTEPRLGWVLRKVSTRAEGVSLSFDQGTMEVDRVILTLPPRVLESICFDPPLPTSKRCAIEACGMSRAIKLVWQFDRPWWEDLAWGGSMLCDSPIQQTWLPASEAAVMCAYVCGEQAEHWTGFHDPAAAAIEELTRLFPAAGASHVRGWAFLWPNEPFARGAFSHLPPRFVLEHMEHLAPAVGPIHFAGEHTAQWTGFVEGALESAERVATELTANVS